MLFDALATTSVAFRVVALVAVGCVVLALAARVWSKLITEPLADLAYYKSQGVPGGGFTPVVGDLGEVVRMRGTANPFLAQLERANAKGGHLGAYTDFIGPTLQLTLTDPDWIQEVR